MGHLRPNGLVVASCWCWRGWWWAVSALHGAYSSCVDDRVVGSMSIHRYRRVHVRLDPGSLVLGEGVDATPKGTTRGARGTRATLEAVVCSFGSPRWWRRWPLLYSVGGIDMAADVAGDTSIPLCWGGLPGGPRHGVASWGGVRPSRYVMYLYVLIYLSF
jgi:hypothetical protein